LSHLCRLSTHRRAGSKYSKPSIPSQTLQAKRELSDISRGGGMSL
jgi:hypothetical protein